MANGRSGGPSGFAHLDDIEARHATLVAAAKAERARVSATLREKEAVLEAKQTEFRRARVEKRRTTVTREQLRELEQQVDELLNDELTHEEKIAALEEEAREAATSVRAEIKAQLIAEADAMIAVACERIRAAADALTPLIEHAARETQVFNGYRVTNYGDIAGWRTRLASLEVLLRGDEERERQLRNAEFNRTHLPRNVRGPAKDEAAEVAARPPLNLAAGLEVWGVNA